MNEKGISANAAGSILLGGQVTVNRLGFGAMRITGKGIWDPPKDRERALAVLRHVVDLGVNFIDIADSYGSNVSEELIAEALFPYPKDLVIATKGGWNRPGPNQWTHDATPAHLRKAVEGSLERPCLDRLDVYQFHIPDPSVSFEKSVEALAEMRGCGYPSRSAFPITNFAFAAVVVPAVIEEIDAFLKRLRNDQYCFVGRDVGPAQVATADTEFLTPFLAGPASVCRWSSSLVVFHPDKVAWFGSQHWVPSPEQQ